MAKKITTQQNTSKVSWFSAIRGFFTNERTRFIAGLILFFITLYVGLALISFFFTGAADQSKVENVPVSDLLINRGSVDNWTEIGRAHV